ncbi:zf-TFIIB domain-containing protein [Methylomonas sp. EFPC3]|uniref:TFIIB-type zinc ribbon-containing protein n=1 Tax=Methylomonas sp. EFPC3 TaxID=3021710 RepID=UPI00241808F4|nr:zf-TFIIB domain-containing protein [Methylomonas sp. EFPC3]WFP50793.1 zf-TFIIB domain-containing protein [Methylomonas sp. EFPC3]
MASCANCAAPLPANSQVCRYCGVRNDMDLLGRQAVRVADAGVKRQCPNCEIGLQTVALSREGTLHIERCSECFGLFFDPGELEVLLEDSVAPVADFNLPLLQNINRERYQADRPVKYLKCPVCQVLMNRMLYGYQSGVVVNRCKGHGVWLDNGQISHLLEWKKAGGQLLDRKKAVERQVRGRTETAKTEFRSNYAAPTNQAGDEFEVLETIAEVVFKLFE